MSREILRFTLYGDPKGKKNSQKVVRFGTRYGIAQGDTYKQYAKDCARQITGKHRLHIDEPVNICAIYYRRTKIRVDRPNLENALLDILQECGVITDDCRDVAAASDGSRVYYDKENPRTEIIITALEEPGYSQWKKRDGK